MVKILVADDEVKYGEKLQYSVEKDIFLKEWMLGKVQSCDLKRKINKFGIIYTKSMALIVIKPLIRNESSDKIGIETERLNFAISSVVKEIMGKFKGLNIFVDSKDQVVVLCDVNPIKEWHSVVNNIENAINAKLNINVVICASFLREDPVQVNIVYKSLCNRLMDKSKRPDMLIEVQKYINRHYFKEDLSIAEIANKMEVSQTYLIRLFKRNLKMTFVEYLTNVRIKNAIILMRDPTLTLSEIAELVGYNTQHYFNNVFRRHVGISPQEYRLGISKENRL
ncbi:helix-turn-helix transcriptional regulator [Clostridium saudiense]|uniref:helix-turn-helix transcriptional regulator n=1 Tax=Clostridium saudiense TaxID=1414720 RepID=UPI00266FDC80|nr:AraC family transcriptional regulator [Clostridium saudiense]